MDDILYEMGTKWQTISKDQQVALAQTVAGVRQYTQLVALMDQFDFYQENLNRAQNADGALEKQADIYAESWEASQKRVQAAIEEVYTDLIDDDFFIGLNDALAGFIGLLDNLLKSMGGAKGLLTGVASILLNMFAGQAAQGLENMVYNFKSFVGLNKKEAQGQKNLAINLMQQGFETDDPVMMAKTVGLQKQIELEQFGLDLKNELTELEKAQLQEVLQQNQAYADQYTKMTQIAEKKKDSMLNTYAGVDQQVVDVGYGQRWDESTVNKKLNSSFKTLTYGDEISKEVQTAQKAYLQGEQDAEAYVKKVQDILAKIKDKKSNLYQSINGMIITTDGDIRSDKRSLRDDAEASVNSGGSRIRAASKADAKVGLKKEFQNKKGSNGVEFNVLEDKDIDNVIKKQEEYIDATNKEDEALKNLNETTERQKAYLQSSEMATVKLSTTLVNTAQAASSFAFALSSLSSLKTTWADESIGAGEKLLQTFMSLSMTVPMLMNGITGMASSFNNWSTIIQQVQQAQTALNAIRAAGSSLATKENAELLTQMAMKQVQLQQNKEDLTLQEKKNLLDSLGIAYDNDENAAITANILLTKAQTSGNVQETLSELVQQKGIQAVTKALWEKVKATWASLQALLPYIAAIGIAVVAIGLLVAGVKASINAYNSDANAAAEAAESAQRAAEAFETAQQKYEDLKTSMTNYEDAVTGLKSLTEGTVEFTEQLITANEAAMELINNNDLIYGKDYTYDKNGLITFNNGVLEQAQNKSLEEMELAQAEKIYSNQRAKSLQTKADMVKYNREELGSATDDWEAAGKITGGLASGAALGAGAGAAIGTIVPIFGTAIGAGVGAIVGAIAGLGAGIYTAVETYGHSTDDEEKAMTLLAEQYSKIGDGVLTEEQIRNTLNDQVDDSVIENLIQAADKNAEALKAQLQAISANTAALQASLEASAKSANANNKEYNKLSEENQSLADKVIAKRAAATLSNEDNEEYKAAKQKAKDLFKGDDQDAYDEYMEIVYGKDWRKNYRVVDQGGTNATIQKRLEDGTDQWENVTEENGLSNDEVIDRIAQNTISQYNLEQDAKVIEQLNNVGDALLQINPNLDNDTVYSVKSSLASGQAVDLSLMTPEQIADLKSQFQDAEGNLSESAKETFGEYAETINAALDKYTIEDHKKATQAKADEEISSAAATYELDEDSLKTQAKLLQQNNDYLKDNAVAAAKVAIANQRMNKGVDSLTDNWDDLRKTLKTANKTTQDYADALTDVEDSVREILRLDPDEIIPDGFLESDESIGLLDEIANGSSDAVEQLQFNLLQAQISSAEMSNDISANLSHMFDGAENWSADDFNTKWDEIKSGALTATQEIQNAFANLQPGESLSGESLSGWISALNTYIEASGMTVDEVNAMFEKMQVKPEVNTTSKKITTSKDKLITHVKITNRNIIDGTYDRIEEQEVVPGEPVTETVEVPSINADATFTKIDAGSITPSVTKTGKSSGGGSSGSGGSAKDAKSFDDKDKKEKQKYEDEYDRYRDITEAIDEYNDALSEISAQKDEAFGADKLAAMDKEKAKYNQLIAKQKDYITAISGVDGKGGYLAIDQAELAKYGGQFDEEGRLTNYHELTQGWLNDVNAATDKYNSTMASITETFNNSARDDAAEEVYNNAKEQAENDYELATKENDKRKEALDKWQETYDLNEKQIQQLNDYYRELRSLNYEKLEYKIEIRVELNESDLSDIEHQLSRLSDTDYTKSAERIALISKNASPYKLMADDQKRFIEELKAQYAAGDINQEDFIAGLKEAKDAILEAETQIREGIVTVGDELRNAFSLTAEQLDKVYEKIDRRLDFADFYKDISIIINGETDYDILNSMIDAQTDLMEIRVDGLINERDALIRKQTELYTALGEAATAEEKAQIRETLDKVESEIADTNSEIQSGIQSLAEYAQEEFENAIAAIAKAAEEQLLKRTGLSTLEAMLEHIDNLHTAQNLVLTTTNKIYETNKLINQAEKDINATTNKRAQQAYQEYINKVKQKQEQNEMTEFELDLLTAEYEITKAQIALEEAQNAKDTVRLTRDSEGNYGYVYTANQDKVSDAEQALEDAKNNAYNVSKDMLDEMSSAWVENEQAVKDALTELAQEYAKGNIDIDEYEQRRNETIASYRAEAERINKNYYLALDSMTEYSYNTDEDYTTQRVQRMSQYDTFVETINDNMGTAAENYQARIETVADKVETAYGDEEDAVDYVKKATEVYGDELDELIPQMETDLTRAIGEATSAWDEYCEKLREVIKLSDMITGDTHDTLLQETYKDDYAQQIKNLIEAGEKYDSADVQKLLSYRWNKLGGNDETNYQELMNQYDEGSLEYQLYDYLRRYKISQTDWFGKIQEALLNGASLSSVQWMIDIRDEKTSKNDTLELVKQWAKENGIPGFASGGYTGDWGPSGKLAVLHEKELVLNADDTANILASVDIIREISRSLDNSALWAMLGMGQLNAATIGNVGGDTLQQQVEIHADFPNVTDHNEIEMAIDNLINAASQYAYRG